MPPVGGNRPITIAFYSHELGNRFPHAFVVLDGQGPDGKAIDGLNFGFSAVAAGPGVFFGSVRGYVHDKDADYITKSQRQFTLTITPAQYAAVLAKKREWETRAQPSYNLNRNNCVHFVMEIAEILGLKVNRNSKYFRRPRSFLIEVRALNPKLSDGR